MLSLFFFVSAARAQSAPDLVRQMSAAWASLHAYTTAQVIQERVGGDLTALQHIKVAFRKPWEIQLEWIDVHPGRKVYWCASRHDGEVQVYPGGLVGRAVGVLSLSMSNSLLKQDTNYTPADAGFGYLVAMVARLLAPGAAHPPTVGAPIEQAAGGEPAWAFTLSDLAEPRFTRAEVSLSQTSHLPLAFTAWQADGAVEEHYEWHDTVVDPQLQDQADFDLGYR